MKDKRFFAAALAVVLLAALCSAFFVQLLLIHGDSMSPVYRSGSLVLLQKRPAAYSRGDVVLCRSETLGRSVVKRIAATEGDALAVEGDGLYINGVWAAAMPEESERAVLPAAVPPGQFLLLGDNRAESVDSRNAALGLVTQAQLRGRVIFPVRAGP
ncbi:MAG: signal peptidase I [Oscillospiraceae bacterium]|nr:signal peptidase I [Oscillospiraceae bacterium]